MFANTNTACKRKLDGPNVPKIATYLYSKVEAFLTWTVKYDTNKKETE